VILAKLLNKVRPTLLTDTQIDTLASKTIGFSGADLVNLVREASLTAIRRAVAAQVADELPKGSEIPEVDVLWEDIEAGLKDSRGSVLNAPIYHPYNKTNAQIFFT
jgi:SpoVK/Ycf46/Vps4 family AAA+-type ATPase